MITTNSLSKYFEDFCAVDQINIQVNAGEVLALLGPNGAGKTTTIRLLTSLLKPTSGWAKIAGFDVVEQPSRVRASVGVLTEHHGLYSRMRAGDYLDYFGQIYGMERTARNKQIDKMLDIFGLQNVRLKRIGKFSKGMRQKLALARALIHEPPVLLLDEPTSAMDPESAHLVRESIQTLRSEERAIIICTHNLSEAEELADKFAIIKQGKIIHYGTPAKLRQQMLGQGEYEIKFSSDLNGSVPSFPPGVSILSSDSHWIRYSVRQPEKMNPVILNLLLEQDLPVLTLSEIPRSLEQVYLQAVNQQEIYTENDT